MVEFRDWREPYRIARARLFEARRHRMGLPADFLRDLPPEEYFQKVADANARRVVEFNPTEKTDGELKTPMAAGMERGRMKKTSRGRDGKSIIYGAQPGTKAFYREKSLQAPEPYIERIDDFGEGGGGVRGGITSTILSGRTGEELKDQAGARRRMTQGAVTRHAKAVANSEPAVETELP